MKATATRLRGLGAEVVPVLIPASLLVALWTAWTAEQGGYFPEDWLPGAIGVLILGAVVSVACGYALPRTRPARVALLLFAAFVAWSYASMLWSASPASAWDASNKLFLYLLTAWVVSLLPWTSVSASSALGGWSLAVTAVLAASLISATGTSDLGTFFIEDRYFHPIGYVNGVSAMAVMAAWPAVWLAASSRTPPLLAVLFTAAATYLLCFALIPQSRGAVLGVLVGLPVLLALAPERLRLLGRLVVIGAAVALAVGPVYEVYDVGDRVAEGLSSAAIRPVLDDAARAIVRSVALAAAAAAVLIALERVLDGRLAPRPRAAMALRRAVAGACVLLALAGLVVAVANAGRIRDEASDRLDDFTSREEVPAGHGPRLIASGSDQRTDYWRVALEAFDDEPVHGLGAGNFQVRYSADREDEKPSRYAHDIWLRFLSEGGIVGIALFLATLVALVVGGLMAYRRADSLGRGAIGVTAALLVYFLAHASLDWLEEFPALAAPALAFPFSVLGLQATATPFRRQGRISRAAELGGLGLLVAAGLVALAMPWMSVRYTQRAEQGWRADPQAAYRDLERAGDWNPLSPQPRLREAAIALGRGDERRARVAFERSIEVEDTWYARMELAILSASERHFKVAQRELRRAQSMNSVDPSLDELARLIAARRRVDVERFNRRVRRMSGERFTRPVR